ncbi:bisdemethoxycurcumin synthase-like [Triticum dicoccoides]|uniref:bisdemethoxycurcumin synthase-like n=1 Tax=Triticum dicoccoides TaxID=85692 RepID=UPI00188E1740|nr:bisdemethoxycurcumin synthase-like [Triticum dicoccoides]
MATVQQIRRVQRADGPAAVLAIGTANPASSMLQDDYTDYYFRVTNSEHHADLKDKLKRICKKSGIERRYAHLDEELLGAHPDFTDRALRTLDARIDMASAAVPELAASAAAKAIAEWGRPAADVTHLVFSTYSGRKAPSADLRLASLLGLRPTVSRTILSLNGCSGGGRALQLAKELAENNRGAREGRLDTILGHGIFGDGAGAVIVGADPVDCIERPLFEMVFATQTTIPETEDEITMRLMKGGLDFHVSIRVPKLLKSNIERCMIDAFESIGISAEWNDLFWAIHPGGRAILDHVEQLLGLGVEELAASRRVLREYGNMSGATVIFVLNELRRRRARGEEVAEWGVVMMAFGPGITIETMVLHAAGSLKEN